MTRLTFLATLLVAVGSTAIAADAVKVNLKDFKWKAAFDGGADLGGYDETDGRFFLYTNGTASGEVAIPEDGEYTVTVEASSSAAEKELAQIQTRSRRNGRRQGAQVYDRGQEEVHLHRKAEEGQADALDRLPQRQVQEGEYDLNLFVYSIAIEKK